MRRLGSIALVLTMGLFSLGSGVGTVGAASDAMPGEILVKFRPGASDQTIADAHRRNGGQIKEIISGIGVQVVSVPVGQEAATAATYHRDATVAFAEVNGRYGLAWTPSDAQVGQQWQYNNSGQTGGTADADISAFEAWDVTRGSSSVAIAMLDTGISQSHPDLAGKVVKNVNFTTSSTVDDLYGHGTHTAGSAGALTNNASGVAGTCPNCALYNVKVLGDDNYGYWTWIANGITWATDNGAKVISMSIAGSSGSSTLASAVDYAWNRGVVVVVAAGNNGTSAAVYPAYYTNAIAVAATDANDAKAGFSTYGSWVDVAAPGVSILSTLNNGDYGYKNGTSMATPHVAGIAGLVWSSGLCSTNSCVRSRIEGKADAIAGTGTYWAYGRVNACRSVSDACGTSPAPAPTAPAAPSGLSDAAASSSQINLTWTDNSSNEDGFKIERCQGSGCTSFAQVATVGAGVTTYQDTGLVAATSYTYRALAYNAVGTSGYSNLASATTASALIVPIAPSAPAAPSSLSTTAVSSSQINVSWADLSSNEDGFKVERCQGAGCTSFAQVATVGAGVTTYHSSGLSANTSYSYRVRAYNSGGDSAYSNTAKAKTARR